MPPFAQNPLHWKSALTIVGLLLVWLLMYFRRHWLKEAEWTQSWESKPLGRQKRDEMESYASANRIKGVSAALVALLLIIGLIVMWIYA